MFALTDCPMYEANKLISSLSFDEYVLIDCLKFNRINNGSKPIHLDFVALTGQGFLNIFNEIKSKFKYYWLRIHDNQLFFVEKHLNVIIRHISKQYTYVDNLFTEQSTSKVEEELTIKKMIEMPGLDFYKCYYDGYKIHSTPEALNFERTGNLQYKGKMNLNSSVAKEIFGRCNILTNIEFWTKTNGKYIGIHNDIIFFGANIFESEPFRKYSFPTELDVQDKRALFGSKFMFTLGSENFKEYEKRVYKFIEEIIFKNPISSLN
jgi:hypothetical protein